MVGRQIGNHLGLDVRGVFGVDDLLAGGRHKNVTFGHEQTTIRVLFRMGISLDGAGVLE